MDEINNLRESAHFGVEHYSNEEVDEAEDIEAIPVSLLTGRCEGSEIFSFMDETAEYPEYRPNKSIRNSQEATSVDGRESMTTLANDSLVKSSKIVNLNYSFGSIPSKETEDHCEQSKKPPMVSSSSSCQTAQNINFPVHSSKTATDRRRLRYEVRSDSVIHASSWNGVNTVKHDEQQNCRTRSPSAHHHSASSKPTLRKSLSVIGGGCKSESKTIQGTTTGGSQVSAKKPRRPDCSTNLQYTTCPYSDELKYSKQSSTLSTNTLIENPVFESFFVIGVPPSTLKTVIIESRLRESNSTDIPCTKHNFCANKTFNDSVHNGWIKRVSKKIREKLKGRGSHADVLQCSGSNGCYAHDMNSSDTPVSIGSSSYKTIKKENLKVLSTKPELLVSYPSERTFATGGKGITREPPSTLESCVTEFSFPSGEAEIVQIDETEANNYGTIGCGNQAARYRGHHTFTFTLNQSVISVADDPRLAFGVEHKNHPNTDPTKLLYCCCLLSSEIVSESSLSWMHNEPLKTYDNDQEFQKKSQLREIKICSVRGIDWTPTKCRQFQVVNPQSDSSSNGRPVKDEDCFWKVPYCLCIVSKHPFIDKLFEMLFVVEGFAQLQRIASKAQRQLRSICNSRPCLLVVKHKNTCHDKEWRAALVGASVKYRSVPLSDDALSYLTCIYVAGTPPPGSGMRIQPVDSILPSLTIVRPRGVFDQTHFLSKWNFPVLFARIYPVQLFTILVAVLLEYKILVVSASPAVSSAIVLALMPLIHPFKWHHVSLPTCPNYMSQNLIHAPVPFLLGVTPSAFGYGTDEWVQSGGLDGWLKRRGNDLSLLEGENLEDVVCVDADTGGGKVFGPLELSNVKFPGHENLLIKVSALHTKYRHLSFDRLRPDHRGLIWPLPVDHAKIVRQMADTIHERCFEIAEEISRWAQKHAGERCFPRMRDSKVEETLRWLSSAEAWEDWKCQTDSESLSQEDRRFLQNFFRSQCFQLFVEECVVRQTKHFI
eukprot:GHVL01036871.1.p1 GENE.GHVL01036871.1~~GHVL01036871.1.p1  ORF type:complete len:995 (-),score=117.99 GHVL01036871.1:3492-6476(-)